MNYQCINDPYIKDKITPHTRHSDFDIQEKIPIRSKLYHLERGGLKI